jgi:hypothetical protein
MPMMGGGAGEEAVGLPASTARRWGSSALGSTTGGEGEGAACSQPPTSESVARMPKLHLRALIGSTSQSLRL